MFAAPLRALAAVVAASLIALAAEAFTAWQLAGVNLLLSPAVFHGFVR